METLKSRNRYLTGLLEKAAANTIARDVAERVQDVLTEELHHRMKNMLAMVTAIIRQSMRTTTDMAVAEAAIMARLVAMARAHDLLLKADWKTAGLRSVALGAIAQHNADINRILVEGEEVEIHSSAIVPMTLLLNELCTNATKYGALSNSAGQVLLTWARDAAGTSMIIRWTEKNGPKLALTGPKSFGTKLIENALPHQFGGHGVLSFPPTGAEFELTIPLKNLLVLPEAG